MDNLFVRGSFNWWSANDAHAFSKNNENQWVSRVNLEDGINYQFKLSDAYWTPENTCGAVETSVKVTKGQKKKLECGQKVVSLEFQPTQKRSYQFVVLFEPKSGQYFLRVE